jgi:hypothetical protein
VELLRLVARRMQDAPAGLAGNHVPGPDLLERFHVYLDERFKLSPDRAIPVARAMLSQFRERNFILARFGGEVYGFVHRAFLEYLAAEDIHQRFTNRDLSEEELIAVFDRHWADPAWQEVLLLLAGMIPERFAAQAIDHLLHANPGWRLRPQSLPRHALLALQMTSEVRKTAALSPYADTITHAITGLLQVALAREKDHSQSLAQAMAESLPRLLAGLGPAWAGADIYQTWYRNRARRSTTRRSSSIASLVAARLHVFLLPRDDQWRAIGDQVSFVRRAAVEAIAAGWAEEPGTLPLLRERATGDQAPDVRYAAVQAIAAGWAEEPGTLQWLRERATGDQAPAVRYAAVQAIAAGWAEEPGTLQWLRERATGDQAPDVRRAAVETIAALEQKAD